MHKNDKFEALITMYASKFRNSEHKMFEIGVENETLALN